MAQAQYETLEAELSELFRSGDLTEVLRRLVEGYGAEILGYLARTMRNEADAAEVFSILCEDLCRGIGAFQGRSSFRTWAYRLATSARARYWSDAFRRHGSPLLSEEAAKLEQQVRSATRPYLRTEVKDRFARLREHLDPEEQSLLTLRLDRDLSWTEIAEILEGDGQVLPAKELQSRAATWRQRFKRLKDKIRRLADAEGLLETD
jgi:RNA polymerase sigma-70 factor (ECF subfamily)